jgi:hypothetical protein
MPIREVLNRVFDIAAATNGGERLCSTAAPNRSVVKLEPLLHSAHGALQMVTEKASWSAFDNSILPSAMSP